MSAPANKQLPRYFGKYELLEYLGGGMADVYRARDLILGKIVAVKILKDENCADDDVRARFLDEARTAASFDHDNIINVFDFGEYEGQPFMVMEFLRGEDLGTAIQSGSAKELSAKLNIALHVARALDFIHAHDIVHRDIKPANIHISQSGVPKLIDFGIAKNPEASVKTQTGFAVGTLYYMAPEQVLGRTTRLVDIYAFGLVLYELMCGRRAVAQDTMERTFYKILHEPIDLKPVESCASPEVADLIRRCTAKLPEERIQTFADISSELERLIGIAPVPTMTIPHRITSGPPSSQGGPALETELSAKERPAKKEPKRRRTIVLTAAALVTMAMIAGAVWWLSHRPNVTNSADRTLRNLEKTGANLPLTLSDAAGDMVLVPKGKFLLGSENTPSELPDFYIDRTEVTNRAYARYSAAKKLPKPKGDPALPVTNVTVRDARGFCEWAGKVLPTMEEWEKAARGTDGRDYPWGHDADPTRANVEDNPSHSKKTLMPAYSMPGGASPFGALNMAGNAWEYVDGVVQPNPDSIAGFKNLVKRPCSITDQWVRVRGGSYQKPLGYAVAREFVEVPGCYPAADIGFRCAKRP